MSIRKDIRNRNWKGIAVLSLTACTVFGLAVNTTAQSETPNKTAVIDSSYYTRFTAPVAYSALTSRAGASIELDVVDSELKTEENIRWIREIDPTLSAGSALADHPLAGVTFDFWNESAGFANCAHGLIGASNTNPSSTSFNYYADGQIRLMYYGDSNNGSTRALIPITSFNGAGELVWNEEYGESLGSSYQEETNCVGDIQEVQTFLDAGYAYKLDFIYGFVSQAKEVSYGESYRADGGGKVYNPWYVAYKKPIGATEWEFSFAIPLNRNSVSGSASQGNSYAGFEICANQGWFKQSVGNGLYDNFGNNVKMEIDNVAIYSREEGAVKTVCTFDNVNSADFDFSDDSGIKSSGRTYNGGVGANFPNLGREYRAYYDENSVTVDGITVNSINAPMEGIEKPASRALMSRPIYTVEYKDRATGKTIVTRSVLEGLDAIEPTYQETGTLYEWESKATAVVQDTVVYGSENNNPFTISFDLNGGTGTVAPIQERFGKEIVLPTEGFSKEHYDFVGWAIQTEQGVFKAIDKYTVKDYDDTLYALWELSEYTVKFYDGAEILYQTQVKALSEANYEGKEPIKVGAKFVGWDGAVDLITGNTDLHAQYIETYDESVSDKTATVSVTAGSANTLFFGRKYVEGKKDIAISVDFLSVSLGGAKAFITVGGKRLEITGLVKSGVTVRAVYRAYGKYEISVKSVSAKAFEKVAEGVESAPYPAGEYGFVFAVPEGAVFSVTIDELSVAEIGLPFVEEFEYSDGISAGTRYFKNGTTVISASVENSLSVAISDNPKRFCLTYINKATGEVLETRRIRSGETAELYEVKGYAVSAEGAELAKLNNITADTTVAVTLTPNLYSVHYNTIGIADEIAVGYGRTLNLPKTSFVNGYGIVGWSRGQDAVTPEFKAGESIAMPAENLVLYPVYGYQTFTVTFLNADGTVLETREVIYRGTAVYAGQTPVKDGYRFVGWDKQISSVTENITVKAVFEELPKTPSDNLPQTDTVNQEKTGLRSALFIGGGIALAIGCVFFLLACKKKKFER